MKNKTLKTFALFIFFSICVISVSIGQNKLTVNQFDSLIKVNKTVQLIDVRTSAEMVEGYIKGAKNIDYNSPDFLQRMNSLDKSRPVAVYCGVGGRSGRTAIKLKEAGFAQIFDLQGGLTEWKVKQKPIEVVKK